MDKPQLLDQIGQGREFGNFTLPKAMPYLLIAMVVVVLYGLAFNTYVQPNNGDDITYYDGARSIASGNGFKEQRQWIVDWPPVQSAIVALAMRLTGIRDFYLVKIVNALAVIFSLLLAYRVSKAEKRLAPTVCCILIAILPTSLVVGSAGQADFSYFAFSMLFILFVYQLQIHRSLHLALACGFVLGIASLTRWQGVILGVCLLFQMGQTLLRSTESNVANRLKGVFLETTAAVMGASIFLSWKFWLRYCFLHGNTAPSNYAYLGEEIWCYPNPIALFTIFLNLFTQMENIVLTFMPTFSISLVVAVLFFFALSVWGFILRIRSNGWMMTDAYVVCTILLLSTYVYRESRYGIPIAIFLLDYLFHGFSDLQVRFGKWFPQRSILGRSSYLFFAAWMTGLLLFDGILIFYGDGESMGPATQLALRDNRDYLRGYHRELYDVCKIIGSEYPNAIVASDKFHKQIIRHYSGVETHFVGFAPDAKFTLFVEVNPECLMKRANELSHAELEFPPSLKGRLSNPRIHGYVTLWEVDAIEPNSSKETQSLKARLE